MLAQDIDEFNVDVMDGIGEIVNMVLGGIKMRIVEIEHTFDISIPTCFKGSRMVVLTDIKKTHMVNCNYKMGDIVFAISLMYKEKVEQSDKEKMKQQALERLKMLSG